MEKIVIEGEDLHAGIEHCHYSSSVGYDEDRETAQKFIEGIISIHADFDADGFIELLRKLNKTSVVNEQKWRVTLELLEEKESSYEKHMQRLNTMEQFIHDKGLTDEFDKWFEDVSGD